MSSAQRQPGRQSGGDERQLGARQLPLQRLGLGAHDDAASGGGPCEGRRQQVGEALAHAGAGLEDADAAALEDVGGGFGVGHLSRPPAEARADGRASPGVRRRSPSPAPARRRHASDFTGRIASGPGPSGGSSATSGGGASSGAAAQASSTCSGAHADALEQAPLHVGEAGRAPGEARQHRRGGLGVGQRPVRGPTIARAPPPAPAGRAGRARDRAGAPPRACRTTRRTAAACRRAAPPPPGARGRRRRCARRGRRRRRTPADSARASADPRRAGQVGVRDAGEAGDEQRDRHARGRPAS